MVDKAPGPTDNIVQILKDTGTDVVVNYLPVGSEMATKWYVEHILESGCAFVNCIPVFIASQDYWPDRFREHGVPIIGDDNVHVDPSDYVSWLTDRKWCHIRMEGHSFGDVPLNLELKLEVWDSPNSAGVVIDAVRCAKLALDRGISGPLREASAYFMKSPPVQYTDDQAHRMVEEFILGD